MRDDVAAIEKKHELESKMAGKFEVYKDKAGEFRFRLKAGNGENILGSEGYKAKRSCLAGIESVKKNSQNPDRFVKKASASGKFTFSLTATNGQVVGTSQSYDSDSGCANGIKSVAKNAPGAAVVDES